MKKYLMMSLAFLTMILWASAFVGIRYGLRDYHPGSMALLRYLIASLCMLLVYMHLPHKTIPNKKQSILIFLCGALGIGLYNISLNYGEVAIPAAIASFTISQSPVLTTILAICFLGERLKFLGIIGIFISVFGVFLIAYSHHHQENAAAFHFGLFYVIIAVVCSCLYSVLQKPLLGHIRPIQFVCYAIWAGTLVLCIYFPQLMHDIKTASLLSTLVIIYMGIFPAAIAYMLWSYLLAQGSMIKSVALLYALPLATMLLGWLFLSEIPSLLAIVGGFIALFGAYLVNQK